MTQKTKILCTTISLLLLFGMELNAQLFPNGDFETGTEEACHCPPDYTCYNDAGRVVDGIHPLYQVGNTGCTTDPTDYTCYYEAYRGSGYVFFYAGSDQVITPDITFDNSQHIELSVWYAGPYPQGPLGQNGNKAYFTFGINGSRVGPKIPIKTATPWTQHYFDTTLAAGTYNFRIMSGESAQYVFWFDDFYVDTCRLPSVDLGDDTSLCTGESMVLDAFYPESEYLWSDNSTDSVLLVDQVGTYWVEVTNECGSVSDTIVITQEQLPEINLGADTSLCDGDTLQLNAYYPFSEYYWQDSSDEPEYDVFQSGEYWVEVTNKCGSSSDTIVVFFNENPHVEIGFDTVLCEGETYELNVDTSGGTYLWQDGSEDPAFIIDEPGEYWVQLTVNNCVNSDTIHVDYMDIPEVNLGNDTVLCQGDTLLLSAGPNENDYLWQDGNNEAIYAVKGPGEYWVQVGNICGIALDTINIGFLDSPQIDLGPDTSICPGDVIYLNAENQSSTYLWQDGSSLHDYYVNEKGIFWVSVSNQCGTEIDSIDVRSGDCDCDIYLPNAFTPNGDGINDIFKVLADCEFSFFELKIFNRWGELIFESNDAKVSWNGRHKGIPCPGGSYVYYMSYRSVNDGRGTLNGIVTITK